MEELFKPYKIKILTTIYHSSWYGHGTFLPITYLRAEVRYRKFIGVKGILYIKPVTFDLIMLLSRINGLGSDVRFYHLM